MDSLYCLPCDVVNSKCETATLVVTYAGSWLGSVLDMAFLWPDKSSHEKIKK